MNPTLRSCTRGLAASLLATSFVHAQIPGSLCATVPTLGLNTGVAGSFALGWVPCPIDNAFNPTGTNAASGDSILAGDLLTPLGGSEYRMTLTVQGFSNLVPFGYPVNGTPSTHFGMAIGNPLGANGYPLQFSGAEAAFVSAMDFYVYDLGGNQVLGPIDVRHHADLHNVDAGGGWDGNIAFTAPQSWLSTSVGKMELVIEYRIGQPNDFWVSQSSGCSPIQGGNPTYMELASAAVTGQPCTIAADNVPYPTLGLWLLLGGTSNSMISLSVLGSDPACYLMADPTGLLTWMPTDPTGVFDNALTFPIPNDPSLAGSEFGLQTLGIYGSPVWPSNGFYVGQYAELTIGG